MAQLVPMEISASDEWTNLGLSESLKGFRFDVVDKT